MRASTFALASPSLSLTPAMSLPHCGGQSFQPSQLTLWHTPTCFCRFSFFSILFKLLSTTAEHQITYGERTPLLLPLLLLQPFMEGVLLGVPSMVPDFDIVFPSMGSFMLNFLTASTSSTPIKCYENTQKLALLDMRGQLCMRIMLGWVLLMVAAESHLSSGLYK